MSSLQTWELQQWALPRLSHLLPLNDSELEQVIAQTNGLSDEEGVKHFHDLLGESPEAVQFTSEFFERRGAMADGKMMSSGMEKEGMDGGAAGAADSNPPPPKDDPQFQYAPPPDPPPTYGQAPDGKAAVAPVSNYGNPGTGSVPFRHHTNIVVEAANVRARDEQQMQQWLQNLQYEYRIFNSDVEPEHDTDYYCNCPIHQYKMAKYRRYGVQDMWSKAVMYPGEHAYTDNTMYGTTIFTRNPYQFGVQSPYGYMRNNWLSTYNRPIPSWHARAIHQTINLNNKLNREAQTKIDAKEPQHSIWDDEVLERRMSELAVGDRKKSVVDAKQAPVDTNPTDQKRLSLTPSVQEGSSKGKSKFSLRKSLGIKNSEERAVSKLTKAVGKGQSLREQIEYEENGRWPDGQWKYLVANYQEKVGMTKMIADLRAHKPTQYLHLLRAGYFEPIPVAWANQASNPLKFSIESAAGWRGITPAWRGYEDTAEERLYWVLNHREGSVGMRMKPDFISEMNMARDRMARAVDPPPLYYAADDTCHLQHTSEGYSKQVMPPPFRAYDRPENPADDTMILLDVSGSMDFDPVRPVYNQYLIERFAPSTQPKNKDVAKSIIRRFADAMANHDHTNAGYDLVTFANSATHIGTINHATLDSKWRSHVRFGGGTRVMTGWQKVKELHFQKHSESATHHPVYGWQAGPETPMLRLLLLLDGEATDMDEFELDLLGLGWAHVTIFLIGVDGCPHHHRHANELQRISDVNHHVSFVDAQGNCPERYVTHELLKRHLGYDVSMREFEEMEELPAYSAVA